MINAQNGAARCFEGDKYASKTHSATSRKPHPASFERVKVLLPINSQFCLAKTIEFIRREKCPATKFSEVEKMNHPFKPHQEKPCYQGASRGLATYCTLSCACKEMCPMGYQQKTQSPATGIKFVHGKKTRNNKTSVKLPQTGTEFGQKGVYFSAAKEYNTLPLQARRTDSRLLSRQFLNSFLNNF